jgi:hypothetical protein
VRIVLSAIIAAFPVREQGRQLTEVSLGERMRIVVRRGLIVSIVVGALAVMPSAAGASLVLGSTAEPSGAATGGCGGGDDVVFESASDPSTQWEVPAPGGFITAWQVDATGASSEGAETLVVFRANSFLPYIDGYTVIATDTETLPFTLPAGDLVTFTVAGPIPVQGGDLLGLAGPGTGAPCTFGGGQTPLDDYGYGLTSSVPPSAGETLKPEGGTYPTEGEVLNLAVTIAQQQDVAVSASAGPAGASAGGLAQLSAAVTNHGPATEPIDVADTVPAGLAITSAVAGGGSCTIAGQRVTCTVTGLAVGASAAVVITVVPKAAGVYPNTVSVASPAGEPDPTPADNTATATLSVSSGSGSGPQRCVVPSLAGTPAAVAKRVLKLLGCAAGRQTRLASRKVPKGAVISTRPGAGRYPRGKIVSLRVSSGPPRLDARDRGLTRPTAR